MSRKAENLDGQMTPHRFSKGRCGRYLWRSGPSGDMGAAPLFFGISWGLIGSFDGAPRRPFGGLLNGQFSSRTLPYGGRYWLGDVGGDDSLDSAVNVNGIDAVVGIATPTTNPGGFLI
jgi:hypothetical protein